MLNYLKDTMLNYLQDKHKIEEALEWVVSDFEEQMQELYEGEDDGFFDVLDTSGFVASFSKTEQGKFDTQKKLYA